MKAANFGRKADQGGSLSMQLSEEELGKQELVRQIWKNILSTEVNENTDFFAAGAGSMDVVRLVEELKDKIGVSLQNEDVFMATKFQDFIQCVVSQLRGGSGQDKNQVQYEPVVLNVNSKEIRFPRQMFVNGRFVDARSGRTTGIINPTDESVICHVSQGCFLCVCFSNIDSGINFLLRSQAVVWKMSMKLSRRHDRHLKKENGAK